MLSLLFKLIILSLHCSLSLLIWSALPLFRNKHLLLAFLPSSNCKDLPFIFSVFFNSKVTFVLMFLSSFPFSTCIQKLILLVGTKLHRIVVKLAVEIMEASPWGESQKFNLRDELFWFRKPRLLLRLIQFISFQVNLKIRHNTYLNLHPKNKNSRKKKLETKKELGSHSLRSAVSLLLCRMHLRWHHFFGHW